MASTLALLKRQGVIDELTPEQKKNDELARKKQDWLRKQRQMDVEAEKRLQDERKWAEDRGYQVTRREEQERFDHIRLKEIEERFKDYKPEVKLNYVDEFGRQVTPKEVRRRNL